MMVRIFAEAKKDENESLKQGRPVYKNVLFREVRTAGKSPMIYPYTEQNHKDFTSPSYWGRQGRFQNGLDQKMADLYQRAYDAYERGHGDAAVDGIPLEDYAHLTAAQVKELKEMGVATVEALAEAGASFCEKYGSDGRELVKRAQNYLKALNDTSGLTSEIEGLRLQVSDLQNTIEVLEDKVVSLEEENRSLKKEAEDKRKSK